MIIEAENMDLIFQAIIRDNVTEELEQIIIPVGKFGMRHYRRIMENTDPNVATDFIIYPELRKAAQKALNKSTDPDEQIFHLGSAFSHTSFSILADVAPKWIKLEADFLNLETICRAIKLGINPDPWLIPDIGVVYHQRAGLSSLGSAEDVISYMVSKFPVSRPLQAALESDDPVVRLEDEALKYIYYQRKRHFSLYGNRKEAILDFFSIKQAEIEDISRILLAKLRSIPAERVRSMLYPIYKRN
jgi:vacuolar-type H+-ATPase subunit C/Vma6